MYSILAIHLYYGHQKQSTIALSSSNAKYIALIEASRKATLLSILLKDLQIKIQHPIIIYYNNASSISIATNLVVNPRTRHIVAQYHFTREKIKSREINLQYVPTMEQVANIFTKLLEQSLFENSKKKRM